jgi:hypothetical protein
MPHYRPEPQLDRLGRLFSESRVLLNSSACLCDNRRQIIRDADELRQLATDLPADVRQLQARRIGQSNELSAADGRELVVAG